MIKQLIRSVMPERMEIRVQALDHWIRGEPEIRLLKRICPPNKVGVDVGANIGTYTYYLQRFMREVVAYEPNPALAERLTRIFRHGVSVRNLAVSNRNADLILSIPMRKGREAHELASVAQDFRTDANVRTVRIAAVSLDSETLTDLGFIKIDVEQHELAVLEGALSTIERCRPIVMTEATPLLYPSDLPSAFEFVTDLGYEGWFFFSGEVHAFHEFRPSIHANPDNYRSGDAFMNTNIF